MSVINQMLKDLEERAPEQSKKGSQTVVTAGKTSIVKLIAIIIVALVALNIIGLYIWSLLEENQALKAKAVPVVAVAPAVQQTALQSQPRVRLTQAVKENSQAKLNAREASIAEETEAASQLQHKSIAASTLSSAEVNVKVKEAGVDDLPREKLTSAQVNTEKSDTKRAIAENDTVKFNEAKHESSEKSAIKAKASMSVSRRQLTSAELIAQKLIKAEKSINANELDKAEQLFEEVLIIEPAQQQARKKLAALWFGRKSFNDAINLLSQGIALIPDNSEFRSMQAHIYLQQGKLTQAYNVLIPLDYLKQQEYQLLIVNISQQISEHNAAIKAYKILLTMQPENSRWHLGLAIVYDKNSQFASAISEYKISLAQGRLSEDSSRFAKERIQILGVK